MAEIINLRAKRKEKSRDKKTVKAEENRAKFGATKSTKTKLAIEKSKLGKALDGAKLDKDHSTSSKE